MNYFVDHFTCLFVCFWFVDRLLSQLSCCFLQVTLCICYFFFFFSFFSLFFPFCHLCKFVIIVFICFVTLVTSQVRSSRENYTTHQTMVEKLSGKKVINFPVFSILQNIKRTIFSSSPQFDKPVVIFAVFCLCDIKDHICLTFFKSCLSIRENMC